jgi:Xaa-Pro aminopeptidase
MSGAPVAAGVERAGRAAAELRARGLDALLVDVLVDVRYLTSFTGSRAMALIRASGDGHLFLTDFRYETQSAVQVPDGFERRIVTGELIDAVAEALAGTSGQLGFDERTVTVASHRRLEELLGEAWELEPASGIVSALRLVKDSGEVARIRAAAELADEALRETLAAGLLGRSEREVAIDLELRMRRLGAEGPSFPSIVAWGPHGALPHAETTEEQIPPDVLVTIDWGALLDGYCSDCTRTYATGEGLPERAREVYSVVLDAQERALLALRAGPSGRELDAVAREAIAGAGHAEHFGHGLGHGVGMEIHEGPRLSFTAGEEPLLAGSVVTIEPGVYLPGELGVRIEDLAVVRDGGADVLTALPKQLTVVS